MGVLDFFRRLFQSEASGTARATRCDDSPRPPADWSDDAGWDVYHQPAQPRVHSSFDLGLQYVADLRAKAFKRVWFPGCGTSLAPRVFAELGFDVLATDFSAIAVATQERFVESKLPGEVVKMLDEHREGHKANRLVVRRHDFRTPLDGDLHDVILNARAFQGLTRDDMRATAKTHYDAVKPGGWTIFETINVQGVRRDEIEDALAEVGYEIPLRETERWFRSALRATGIDFVMILGRPLVMGGKSPEDQARLDALTGEYRSRAEREAEETRAKLEAPDVRIAHVVYSTG